MVDIIKEAKEKGKNIKNIGLEFLDSQGGNLNFVEDCFKIAIRLINGDITERQAGILEQKTWESNN